MTYRKYTIKEIGDLVRSVGVGEAILSGTRSNTIEDKSLRVMWDNASKAMRAITNYLRSKGEDV